MKKLDELNISQTPWKCATNDCGEFVGILNGRGFYVAKFAYDVKPQDASLTAAAPKLYKGLYDAWHQTCLNPKTKCKDCAFNGLRCSEWRAALAEASGEGAGDGK